MGILKNLINAKVSGNVGSMNFRKRGSQTVVAERSYSNSSKGEGASPLQRAHRSRLANIVNFYRVIQAIEARAWQGKAENVSDFNMLSKYNLAASPIFLTKQEAIARACVIAPYEISRGSLATLPQSFAEGKFLVGINLSEGFVFAENTLGTFSEEVIANNVGWKNGDKLSIALLTHAMVDVAGLMVPKADVTYVEITLDVASEDNLMTLPNLMLAAPALNADGVMTIAYPCNAAFAVHSRKTMGVLETSSQSIVMASAADALLAKYSSDAQKEIAMSSYGYQADVLLTPGSVAETPTTDLKYANVTSVTFGGQPLVSGTTLQGGQELVIEGSDFTRDNVYVMVGGVKFVPQTNTETRRTYSVNRDGVMIVVANGQTLYSVTIEAIPTGVANFTFDGTQSTAPKSNLSLVGGRNASLVVNGAELGELSATGVQLQNVGGTASQRTATVVISNGDYSFTISCGETVILSGTVEMGV